MEQQHIACDCGQHIDVTGLRELDTVRCARCSRKVPVTPRRLRPGPPANEGPRLLSKPRDLELERAREDLVDVPHRLGCALMFAAVAAVAIWQGGFGWLVAVPALLFAAGFALTVIAERQHVRELERARVARSAVPVGIAEAADRAESARMAEATRTEDEITRTDLAEVAAQVAATRQAAADRHASRSLAERGEAVFAARAGVGREPPAPSAPAPHADHGHAHGEACCDCGEELEEVGRPSDPFGLRFALLGRMLPDPEAERYTAHVEAMIDAIQARPDVSDDELFALLLARGCIPPLAHRVLTLTPMACTRALTGGELLPTTYGLASLMRPELQTESFAFEDEPVWRAARLVTHRRVKDDAGREALRPVLVRCPMFRLLEQRPLGAKHLVIAPPLILVPPLGA